ncbi:MAG: hybrid sensor histidine kinase/response regulator [Acidiferrobacterales bacterium]|nr:hybrid sensor histidine kinase/response regulator [Acidiferrobacterales bacterium]
MSIISTQVLALAGILYICLLFYIAYRGDRGYPRTTSAVVYSLSLAVYCSSWTFFGAVGTAATRGWDFFAIYLGPILLFLFGYRFIQRIISVSKQQNITSISDFISSRYGKSRQVAILVTCIAVVGSLPYISLQLQAISMAFNTITAEAADTESLLGDTALYSAIMLAIFTILFGTRHLNSTEHHLGLIKAIAFESIVKLIAILMVGYFSYQLLVNSTDVFALSWLDPGVTSSSATSGSGSTIEFLTKMMLSMSAILLLPRQFHVTVVEANSPNQVNTARWLLPTYLLLISIVVLPIALVGNTYMPIGSNADLYVLSMPLARGETFLATMAFIGGLSAATGMVIVAAISLSTMVCNDIVMPILINMKSLRILQRPDINRIILIIRRIVIGLIMLFSYGYYLLSDTTQGLANIGLLSFAAIAQFAPVVLAGLYWQGANRRGAMAGLIAGFATWAYCLLLPNFVDTAQLNLIFTTASWAHPQHLFGLTGLPPLTHGVFWSLLLNAAGIIIGSVRYTPSLIDKIQASIFLHSSPVEQEIGVGRSEQTVACIKDARTLCESIVGEKSAADIFRRHESNTEPLNPDDPVSPQLVRDIERVIASVIGASSARHVVAQTLLGEDISAEDLVLLMDETSQAITFNRELLQAGFENITQGISVIDSEQRLVAWNNRYIELFDYPNDFLYVGMPVEDLIRFNAERGECGPGDVEQHVTKRMTHLTAGQPHSYQRQRKNGRYIKSQGNPMPGGGFVTSFTDTTQTVAAEALLRKVNEELEMRVADRTRDLEQLNKRLQQVTEGKTQFLAAASHDLLQPINAARLFNQSIREHPAQEDQEVFDLAGKVDHSLVSADKLLRALLDISKLDSGSLTAEIASFDIYELLSELEIEMAPLAERRGLKLKVRKRHIGVRSDRRLLRSMLQNFISNAIRYTESGTILVGCRKQEDKLEVQVIDTGIGIAENDLNVIFREFFQIDASQDNREDKGLGLGLSITQRLSQILAHPVRVRSVLGRGSNFSVTLPMQKENNVVTYPSRKRWTPLGRMEGLQVICVEDMDDVLEATTLLLKRWGCEVVACSDVQSSINAFAHHRFDVIVADYSLGDRLSGFDLVMKAREEYQVATGIIISAEQDPAVRNQARASGVFFLPKPVDPSSLRSMLKRAHAEKKEQSSAVEMA